MPSESVARDRAPPKTTARLVPRPAAKATRPAILKPVPGPVATGKRKAPASNSITKRSKRGTSDISYYWFELLFILNQFIVTDITVAILPDTTESVPDNTVSVIPVIQVLALDEFDSEDFLDAVRRDRLFEATDPDDLNVGVDDWLLALDSEGDGDEE
ncbi:unnamed protein product [Phytophthora fragariaefolia]|uniref:Unnamed protein product n=1 Tax=Phytophthora fragariaefolia TaxID=1490495 RepID=A0A9W6Y2X7_9STRA|nr:unnamed protein product [Phytophthora fragariaefolia]